MYRAGWCEPTQTLGTWLTSLRAGDPCPWCGASMHGAESLTVGDQDGEGPVGEQAGQTTLVCGGCGSEIDAADDTPETGDRQLYRAA